MKRTTEIVICLLVIGMCGTVRAEEFAQHTWLLPVSEWSDVETDWSELILRGQDSVYDEPLVTDRPDFTEASSTVGRGVLQLEMGYTFVYDDNEADGSILRSHNTPETLFRYGVTDQIELRLFWNYVWERTIDGGIAESFDGAEDFVVGTKIDLLTECCYRPETAFILEFGTPTGGSVFSTDHLAVGVNLLYSWSLPHDWSLAGSTGYSTSAELASVTVPLGAPMQVNDRHNVFHQSVALGVPITEKIGFYFEYFGLYTDGLATDSPGHVINGGFTYLLNYDTQFDIRAGHGLNDATDDFFGGIGLSKRF